MRHAFFTSTVFAVLVLGSFRVQAYAPCSTGIREHDFCELRVSESHPTQFAVGYIEVLEKSEKLKDMDEDDYQKYLRKHFSPVVIGPGGRLYITDGHHLGRALLELGRDRMVGEVIANFSNLSIDKFWELMESRHWVYLIDENGQGPQDPRSLPDKFENLRDDVYRSLAWAVREAGGYEETDVYFADNLWANFFRSRIELDGTDAGFRRAVKAAIKLAGSDEAKDMPGYIGDDKL